jgi:hypothetical protein
MGHRGDWIKQSSEGEQKDEAGRGRDEVRSKSEREDDTGGSRSRAVAMTEIAALERGRFCDDVSVTENSEASHVHIGFFTSRRRKMLTLGSLAAVLLSALGVGIILPQIRGARRANWEREAVRHTYGEPTSEGGPGLCWRFGWGSYPIPADKWNSTHIEYDGSFFPMQGECVMTGDRRLRNCPNGWLLVPVTQSCATTTEMSATASEKSRFHYKAPAKYTDYNLVATQISLKKGYGQLAPDASGKAKCSITPWSSYWRDGQITHCRLEVKDGTDGSRKKMKNAKGWRYTLQIESGSGTCEGKQGMSCAPSGCTLC